MNKKEKLATLKVLEIYKKEHKKRWYSFVTGIIFSDREPKYNEASVIDFENWLNKEV